MGKGERHRRKRREARERAERERREREAAEAARRAFFEAYDPEDGADGPALPCPECNGFDRRWATADEAATALAAFDAEWGLEPGEGDDRQVAVCRACGAASVVPDLGDDDD